MQISVRTNIKQVTKNMTRIQKKQIPFATSVALNRAANKVRDDEQRGMRKHLDRPTKQTINALYIENSTKKKLIARVFFTDWANRYMALQVYGGTRDIKSTVVPLNRYGGKLNASGNVPGRKAKGWAKRHKQFFIEHKGKTLLMRPRGRDDQNVVGVITSNPQYKKRFPFYQIANRSVAKNFGRFFKRAMASALRTAR